MCERTDNTASQYMKLPYPPLEEEGNIGKVRMIPTMIHEIVSSHVFDKESSRSFDIMRV